MLVRILRSRNTKRWGISGLTGIAYSWHGDYWTVNVDGAEYQLHVSEFEVIG